MSSTASGQASTGITGLDQLLGGGFPTRRMHLIEGVPGTGKTTLALQVLLAARERGERTLYITLSETAEELAAVAESHGWSLDGIDTYQLAPVSSRGAEEYTLYHPAEIELGDLTKAVLERADRVQPACVVQWFDRGGRASAAIATPAQYIGFAVSPDGRQLAFSRTGKDGGADLWLRDLVLGTEKRLTFDGAAYTPQWSPDGTRVAFSGPGEGPPPKVFVKNIAEESPAVRLRTPSPTLPDFASSWSADGRSVVSVRVDPGGGKDLWVHSLEHGVGEPLPVNTRFNESEAKVSPDNRWIAYVTDQSGRDEVWVASFPTGEIRRQVSIDGGTSPQWGDDSREILYLAPEQRLMAAALAARETGAAPGTPRALFRIENLVEDDRSSFFFTRNDYVAASKGQRFLVAIRARDPHAPPITIVVNWLALLKR